MWLVFYFLIRTELTLDLGGLKWRVTTTCVQPDHNIGPVMLNQVISYFEQEITRYRFRNCLPEALIILGLVSVRQMRL